MVGDEETQEHTLFILPIPASLALSPTIFPTIRKAVSSSTSSILILILSPALNPTSKLSHSGTWNQIQSLIAPLYVQASHEATIRDRVLLDIDILLRGTEGDLGLEWTDTGGADGVNKWGRAWVPEGYDLPPNLPNWIHDIPTTKYPFSLPSQIPESLPNDEESTPETESLPSEFPVVALGGTFDHLHPGHKILLGMAAWIASRKIIVGITDDALLGSKSNKQVLEPLQTRTSRVHTFLSRFKPGLEYDLVPIDDIFGPTGWDPDIQALVVSKETVGGAVAIASHRKLNSLPPLHPFVIDVISATSHKVPEEDLELLKSAKMSSTYIREWIVKKQKEKEEGSGSLA